MRSGERLQTCMATAVAVAAWSPNQPGLVIVERSLPEEMPVSIRVNGETATVTIASPADYADLAFGFVLSEGVASRADFIESCEVVDHENGVGVELRIAPSDFAARPQRERSMIARSSCGLCGLAHLDDAIRTLPPAPSGPVMAPKILHAAILEMAHRQPLNDKTRAVHGAAHIDANGVFTEIREDVGRHNALDKLIGALARRRVDISDGAVLLTSRASYEMIDKAATAGVCIMAAMSSPSALALRKAQGAGMTLVGVARDDGFILYAGGARLGFKDFE